MPSQKFWTKSIVFALLAYQAIFKVFLEGVIMCPASIPIRRRKKKFTLQQLGCQFDVCLQ